MFGMLIKPIFSIATTSATASVTTGQRRKQRKNDGHTWFLDLWINTIRLYRSQQEIRQILEVDVQRACPKEFNYKATNRFVEAKLSFEVDRPLSQLSEFLTSHYVKLVGAIHPALRPIIDSFTKPLSKEERGATFLGRKRRYYCPESHPSPERVREYTQSIPPSWRPKILARFDCACVRCKTALTARTAHIVSAHEK